MKIFNLSVRRTRGVKWFCLIFGLISMAVWLFSSSDSQKTVYQEKKRFTAEDKFIFKSKKKALILLTYHRSGSSFLSQYFNQRNDTFFIYEPLLPFGLNCVKGSNDYHQVAYLRSLLKCEIEDQVDVTRRTDTSLLDKDLFSFLQENCLEKNMCFRHKMKALCAEDLCGKRSSTCMTCSPLNATLASRKCGLADIVVIKVIRICDIENLRPLLDDLSLDVKILELIRDPRGVYSSREQVGKQDLGEQISVTCDSIEKNWKKVQQNKNKWLKEKYKLIRYEDVCQHPLEIGRQIYRFVGLDMTQEMEEWIKANTQGDLSYSSDKRVKLLIERMKVERMDKKELTNAEKKQIAKNDSNILRDQQFKDIVFNDPYTTIRNSSTNWRKWTSKLDFRKVAPVQQVCSAMMSTFQYLPVTNDEQLKDTSTVVMSKFCPDNQLTFNKHIGC